MKVMSGNISSGGSGQIINPSIDQFLIIDVVILLNYLY